MKPVVAVKSDVGRVRQANEDSYLAQDPLYAVADGMGGHLAGDIASATAVEVITSAASNGTPQGTADLAQIVQRANAAIWEKAQGDPNLRGMGTTCTLALLDDGQMHIAHVGDSRAYLFRDGELSQLTEDHTLVGRMVREGRLAPEEAERHPQRSIITRALGADSEVDVDELSTGIKEGDRLLLCSDGLTSMIDAGAVHDVLESEPDANAAADRLIELALEAGGEDNVTVVLIDIRDDAFEVAPVPERATSSAPRQNTEPDATPAPPAVDTGVHRVPAEITAEGAARPRWGRALLVTLLILLLLGAGGYAAVRYTLANSYFVAPDDAGNVTIYRGIPEEIAGFSLRETEESTDVAIEDLPDFLRGDVEEGIKADSLDDARAKVRNLEERAEDAEFDRKRSRGNG